MTKRCGDGGDGGGVRPSKSRSGASPIVGGCGRVCGGVWSWNEAICSQGSDVGLPKPAFEPRALCEEFLPTLPN